MKYIALSGSSSSLTIGDIIGILAVLVVGGIFLFFWKGKMGLKPVVALILTLLPFIVGVLVGSLPKVAAQLYHLTGGKIGF